MRGWLKLRGSFRKSADKNTQPLLKRRWAEMDEAWGKLEEGCAGNNERMAEIELRPRTDDEGVVKLNVGGSNVTVCWHLLAEVEGFKDSILGALLEGVWGEGRIPRDADGRIVLDESPTCIKHIIVQTTLKATGRSSSVAVAADEVPCLVYTAHAIGLPRPVLARHPKYVNLSERSTILEPFEIAPLGAKIREWVGSSTEQMTLIYRATRDGFVATPLKARCTQESPKIVSLIRVKSGEGNDEDSIVGGFYVLQWLKPAKRVRCTTAAKSVFMLKDGRATRHDPTKPNKWTPHPYAMNRGFALKSDGTRCLGGNDLETTLDATSGGCILKTGRKCLNIMDNSSPFLALDGKTVVDIEVYRYSTPAPLAITTPTTTKPGGDALADAEAYDVRWFGEAIAASLMQERAVLDRAAQETKAAGARVSAAVRALEIVYGPSVAAGEQDAVMELNVRGTRMTTMRSTLQACPRSALAVMFDEERWPATDKDKDEHGRRLIDCNPTCFSKILDVLRMRKRSSWGRGLAGGEQVKEGEAKNEEAEGVMAEEREVESINGGSGAVLVKSVDAETFGEAVNMYFPGCENFVMDLVQFV